MCVCKLVVVLDQALILMTNELSRPKQLIVQLKLTEKQMRSEKHSCAMAKLEEKFCTCLKDRNAAHTEEKKNSNKLQTRSLLSFGCVKVALEHPCHY